MSRAPQGEGGGGKRCPAGAAGAVGAVGAVGEAGHGGLCHRNGGNVASFEDFSRHSKAIMFACLVNSFAATHPLRKCALFFGGHNQICKFWYLCERLLTEKNLGPVALGNVPLNESIDEFQFQ